jgi:hypothetical protein
MKKRTFAAFLLGGLLAPLAYGAPPPIKSVGIVIKNNSNGLQSRVITDAKGNAEIELPEGVYQIIVERIPLKRAMDQILKRDYRYQAYRFNGDGAQLSITPSRELLFWSPEWEEDTIPDADVVAFVEISAAKAKLRMNVSFNADVMVGEVRRLDYVGHVTLLR